MLSRILLLGSLFLSLSLLASLQGCVVVAAGTAATSSVAFAKDRRSAGTIVEDQAIELKAIHAIYQHPDLGGENHISVLSYNNGVLLVGQTKTEEIKQEAENTIRSIPKVHQIYNELSIGKPTSLFTRSQDSWITGQIKAKLLKDKTISAARIKVITEDGIVYLMGITTPEEQMHSTDIAREIDGVKKVIQIFEEVS